MYVISNSVKPNTVREEQRNGDRYLIVEDVPFVRAMRLVGGYVPESEIRANVDRWDGRPLTVNHPRNDPDKPWYNPSIEDNRPIAVTTSEAVQREYIVGNAESPHHDGTWTRADMAINADVAEAMGGHAADIVAKIEAGEPFDVSSQYVPRPLPAGEYDGQQRANVEGIQRPDSIALLPHRRGQCSRPEGCGINPAVAANDAGQLATDGGVRVPLQADDPSDGQTAEGEDLGHPEDMTGNGSVDGIEWSGTAGGDLDESEISTDDYESHYVFDAETKSASSFPLVDADGNLRRQNVAAAFRFRDDAPDSERLLDVLAAVNDEFDDPPIDSESLDEARGTSANSVLSWGVDRIMSFVGSGGGDAQEREESQTTMPAESGVDDGPQESGTMIDREKLINEITANSALTEDSLTERCDDGLEAIHEDVMSANDDGGDDDGGDDDGDDGGNDGGNEGTVTDENYVTEADLDAKLDGFVDEVADRVTANHENSKQTDLAEEIVANSAEYDDAEDVLEDFPTTAALRTKRDAVTDTGGVAPAGGIAANAGIDEDDVDTEEVSSGVFN